MKCRVPTLSAAFLVALLIAGAGCRAEQPLGRQQLSFLIDWEPGIDYIGFYVAAELGLYEKRNIDVAFTNVQGAPQSATLIGRGTNLIGTTTADQVVIASTKDKLDLKAVATVFARNPVVIASLADKEGQKPITSLKDLVGKRLGMNKASVTFRQFELACQRSGISLNDIRLIDIGFGGTAELLEDRIDALLAYTMERPVQLEVRGRKVQRLWLRDLGVNVIGQVIAAHGPALTTQSTLIRDAVAASMEGWDFARRNPRAALELYLKRFPITDRNYAESALDRTLELLADPLASPYQSQESWRNTVSALAAMGLAQNGLEPTRFFEALSGF